MKKKLLCLVLSAIMILFCFAGCAEKTETKVKEDIGKESSEGAEKLTMYLMSEQPVSAAQEALMEEAVNKITEAKFKIRIDLRYATPDTYYTKLDSDLAEMKAFYEGGAVGKTTHEPVYVDENGLPQIDYPDVEEFDVDIFYFGGYDRYLDYMSKGYLFKLDDEISGSSKALKSVINRNLLDSFYSANGAYYAVPTNRIIGEYEYLLLNKQVLKDTYSSASEFDSLVSENTQELLEKVDKYNRDNYVPLYSATKDLPLKDVKYFGVQANGLLTNDFSVIGGTFDSKLSYGTKNAFADLNNILSSDDKGSLGAKTQIEILKGYEFDGYYATEEELAENKPFAVGYVKGGLGVAEQYAADYEIVPISAPTIDTNDLYESMFGVTTLSNSTSASMKIITFLNENTKEGVEFRNLILYGIEGENYIWKDSEILDSTGTPYSVVQRLTNDPDKLYVMDAVKTGNVATAYTSIDEDPVVKQNMLDHNFGLKNDFVLGFSFYDAINSETPKLTAEQHKIYLALNEFSAQMYQKILDAKNETELKAVFNEINSKFNDNPEILQLITRSGEQYSYVDYYYSWLSSKGLYSEQ